MISPKFVLTGEEAKGLLYGLLEVNKSQLREHPDYPSMRQMVQDGRVVYEGSDPDEHWQSYREMVEAVRKYGRAKADCEDISTAIAAEDQVRYGVMSEPYPYKPKEGLFHVVVATPMSSRYSGGAQFPSAVRAPQTPGWTLEDPNITAGMPVAFGGLGKSENHFHARAHHTNTTYGGLGQTGRSFLKGLTRGAGLEGLAENAGKMVSSYLSSLSGHEDSDEDLDEAYAGVLSLLVKDPIDSVYDPLNDEEEEAVAEMVVSESFGREQGRRSIRDIVKYGSLATSGPRASFSIRGASSGESFGAFSLSSSIADSLDAFAGEELDPVQQGLAEFFEDNL